MNKYRMTHLYNDVHKFNEIAGVFEGNLEEAADLYLSLIFEELSETIAAFEDRDSVELIDGCADILVTAFGLAQVLEKAGFNLEKAVKKVAANNLSKFPRMKGDGSESVFALDNNYTVHGQMIFDKSKDAFDCYTVYKDQNGKIRKPEGFVPVVLNDCVPKEFFDEDFM